MDSRAANQPEHLEPSKLGTKEYWDSLYTTELSNHAADPSDIGTVWFDDSDAETKIVEYLAEDEELQSLLLQLSSREDPRETTSFLDLGCGNGSLLLALRDDGWLGPMLGVDYSAQSVALARKIADDRAVVAAADEDDGGEDNGEEATDPRQQHQQKQPQQRRSDISFQEWDIVAGSISDLKGPSWPGWDVVLDKGTFDAVSLSAETDANGRRPSEGYRDRAMRLVRPGGLFLVTSCNWTEEELRHWFAPEGGSEEGTQQQKQARDHVGEDASASSGKFVVQGTVKYRTFSFGGVKGQTISTVCFRRQ